METLLEVKGLATRFYTRDGVVHAVNGIDFSLERGETLGVVGESGCGKSVSVLSMLQLIPQPPGRIVGGEVLFDGLDLLQMSNEEIRHIRGNRIAMVFQDPMTSLDPVLTIGHQVGEALRVHHGVTAKQARQTSIELLQTVNLPQAEARIDDYPHQFSGGMRQRAMIAMALACDPDILIADEPTTALDVTIQAQILDLIRALRADRGMSIIWITHDLGIIAGLADRVQVMYAGYIVEKALVDDLYDDPRHPYTRGLLASLPRLDETTHQDLTPIEGRPPDLITVPSGCPFHPRCTYRTPKCLKENPQLEAVGPRGHQMACWVDVREGKR